jgi:hypothetical protein
MYFPKNKIITGLYSNTGKFLYADDLTPFSGYYYSLYNGKFFEGQSPSRKNREIILISKANSTTQFSPSVPINKPNETTSGDQDQLAYTIPTNQYQKVPIFYFPQPTEQDYQIGQFIRYFVKKTNESVFLEVNKQDYDGVANQDPNYVFQLYKPFYLYWYITGDIKKTAIINKRVTLQTENLLKLNGLEKFIISIGGYDKFIK